MKEETIEVRKEWLASLLKLGKSLQEKANDEEATLELKIEIAQTVGYIRSIETLI